MSGSYPPLFLIGTTQPSRALCLPLAASPSILVALLICCITHNTAHVGDLYPASSNSSVRLNSTVSPPPSILCVCHLPCVSYIFNEACTHCVYLDRHLFTNSASSRCFFPDRATPVKLCSIPICMFIDCRLHQFLSSIQKGVRIPDQVHFVNKVKKQGVDARLCLLAISLTTCRLNDIRKEVLHYFPDLLLIVFSRLIGKPRGPFWKSTRNRVNFPISVGRSQRRRNWSGECPGAVG